MPPPSNVFVGGWSADKAAKTRCKACRKFKTIANYSNKQQADLRQRIAGPNGEKAKSPVAEIITCRACTGGQVTEMTCSQCGETKGLAEFAKAQRKNPDEARCYLCVHDHITAPWANKDLKPEASDDGGTDEDEDEDGFTETASRTHTTVSNPYERDFSSISSMLKASNLSEHDRAYGLPENKKGSTVQSQSDLLLPSDFNVGPSADRGKGKAKQTVEYYGWDSQGGSHRRRREPSSVYSDDADIVVDPEVRGLGPAKPEVSSNRGFAKVNKSYGMPAAKHPLIEELKAKGTGRTVSLADEEESSDSDDDYMK
ncbi:MAG: hypothetical protein Q9222_002188 [Ikaeria aurantiellina]